MAITPDSKNWTWVLERACPQCGFDSTEVAYAEIPDRVRSNVVAWSNVLERADVRIRPNESTWSPLEYSAHVRDVFRVFLVRLRLMRESDDPAFENWDQDATALAENYNEQNPADVWFELRDDGDAMADELERVPATDLGRTGRRSDGSVFTIETLARYFLHDPVHHLWDVTHDA